MRVNLFVMIFLREVWLLGVGNLFGLLSRVSWSRAITFNKGNQGVQPRSGLCLLILPFLQGFYFVNLERLNRSLSVSHLWNILKLWIKCFCCVFFFRCLFFEGFILLTSRGWIRSLSVFLQGFYFYRETENLSTWVLNEPLYNYVVKTSLKIPQKMPFLDIFQKRGKNMFHVGESHFFRSL